MDFHEIDSKVMEKFRKKTRTPFQKQQEETARKLMKLEEENKRVIEEAIASFEMPEAKNNSSMLFVSGGIFDPGNSSAPIEESVTGRIVEYHLPSSNSKGSNPKNVLNSESSAGDLKEPRQTGTSTKEIGYEFGSNAKKYERTREHEFQNKNLRITNLPPTITETRLWEEFHKYGVIKSCKVLYPHNDDGNAKYSGFILFESEMDAIRAKNEHQGLIMDGYAINITWAKNPDPTRSRNAASGQQNFNFLASPPFIMPPMGHPSLGFSLMHPLPFGVPEVPGFPQVQFSRNLPAVPPIQIVFPRREVRQVIDSLAARVSVNPQVEKMVMGESEALKKYFFLFNPKSPEYAYYLWRVYSLKNGESLAKWSEKPFSLFFGGPSYIPPPMNMTGDGSSALLPECILNRGKILTESQSQVFSNLLRRLTVSRSSILNLMGNAIDYAEYASDVALLISESLILPETKLEAKLARLFLVSDILHNSKRLKGSGCMLYLAAFEVILPKVMISFGERLKGLLGGITAQNLKDYVFKVLDTWKGSSIFSQSYVDMLRELFLDPKTRREGWKPGDDGGDIDGEPIDDESALALK